MSSMPFSFTELVDESHKTSTDETDGDRQDGSTENVPVRSGSSAFSPFFTQSQATTEPELCFTADDLAKAVEEARQDAASETEARLRAVFAEDVAQRLCNMLEAIKDQLAHQQSAFEQDLDQLASLSQELAVALAKAVIPKAIERHPLGDIAASIKTAIRRLATEPSIEMRVSPSLADMGEALLADLTDEGSSSDNITVVADPNLGEGDVELHWQGGMIDRHIDRLQTEALELAEALLMEAPADKSDDQGTTATAQDEPDNFDDGPALRSTGDPQMSESDDEQ